MLAVEVRSRHSRDEELRAIGARASVGHAQQTWRIMKDVKVLIGELGTVNTLATTSIAHCKIATLNHEVRDTAVKDRTFVVQRLAGFTLTFFARAECTKILNSPWYGITEQAHNDSARFLAADLNVKENLVRDLHVLRVRSCC